MTDTDKIAEIRERHKKDCRPIQSSLCHHDREALLRILEFQTENLREQAAELTAAHNQIAELLLKAGNQAVEIERLKKVNDWNEEALNLWTCETGMSQDDYADTVGDIQLKLEAKFGQDFLK